MDPSRQADRYRRIAAGFTTVVRAVPADAWDRPAPCEGWEARDVVRHLLDWVPAFFASAGGPALPDGEGTDDLVAAWSFLDAAIQAGLDDPVVAAGQIDHPRVGAHSFADAIDMFVLGDVLVHTWDLATATGQPVRLDADLVHEMLTTMEPIEELLRDSGQYGPRVEVPADADEQDRLIAFTGRQP